MLKLCKSALLPILQLTHSSNRKRTRIGPGNHAESEQNRRFPYNDDIKRSNGAMDWRLCTRGQGHLPSTWPKFHKNCIASFVCAKTRLTAPGISMKFARRAWPYAFFLKICTVVGIDKGNILSKFRVRKRSGSRVMSKRNFLGAVDFGAWRRPPGRYFYCPFSQDVFSGLF